MVVKNYHLKLTGDKRGLLLKCNSALVKLIPRCLFTVESARIEMDTTTYCVVRLNK